MSFSLYIAKRYLRSKSTNNAINFITYIAIIGVILGSASLFIVLSGFAGLKDFTLQFTSQVDPDLKAETAIGKSFILTDDEINKLNNLKDIAYYSKVVKERVFLASGDKNTLAVIKGVDEHFQNVVTIDSTLDHGNWLEQKSNQLVIGWGISNSLSLGVLDFTKPITVYVPKPGKGDIENPNEAFNKIALLPSGIYSINEELDGKYVFCSMKLAQQFLGLKNNEITNLEIKLKPSADENIVRKELISILGKSIKIKNRAQLNDSLYKMLQSENLFIYLFCTLVVILTLFCLAGAIVMIIIDKRDNLKTLYNIGVTQASIRTIFFTQGIIITLFGLLIGLGIAIGIILLQQHFSFLMITPTMPYPVLFEWQNIGIVVMTIIILGLISSWIASGTVNKKLFS